MGRPQLAVGTYGTITTTWAEREGAYKARARYRDADGQVRPVARFGKTKSAAERALKAALKDRQRSAGLGISGDMLVRELVDEWLTRIDRADLAIGTKQQYTKIAKANVIPALGALRVGEVKVSMCDNALRTIRERNGYSVAKSSRAVMSGVFGLAVRQDALPANPVRDVEKLVRGETKKPRALTDAQETELTDLLRTTNENGTSRAIDLDLPDLVDFMLMTGCRIGEALACRTALNSDGLPLLDLDAGTWEINATVIRIRGEGLVVQEHPKSEAGWRILALPPTAIAMLRARLTAERLQPRQFTFIDEAEKRHLDKTSTLLFPSPSARSLRDPNNTQGDLRETFDRIDCPACSDTGYQLEDDGTFRLSDRSRRVRCAAGPWSWITSHTFRKTVATRMEEAGCTARQVADQLGHSKISMTQDVYFGRSVVVAAAAQILDRS